jgi:hypothetical protein
VHVRDRYGVACEVAGLLDDAALLEVTALVDGAGVVQLGPSRPGAQPVELVDGAGADVVCVWVGGGGALDVVGVGVADVLAAVVLGAAELEAVLDEADDEGAAELVALGLGAWSPANTCCLVAIGSFGLPAR